MYWYFFWKSCNHIQLKWISIALSIFLYQFHYSATNDVQIQYICKIRISKVCPTLHSLSYALKTSKVTNNKVQEDFLWPKSSSWEMIKLDLFPMAVGIKTMASAVHCHFHWLALNFLFACWTSSRDAACADFR